MIFEINVEMPLIVLMVIIGLLFFSASTLSDANFGHSASQMVIANGQSLQEFFNNPIPGDKISIVLPSDTKKSLQQAINDGDFTPSISNPYTSPHCSTCTFSGYQCIDIVIPGGAHNFRNQCINGCITSMEVANPSCSV